MKTLIIDDNIIDRKILRTNLEHHGHEVVEAGNGEEGLRMALGQKPDLIISDALMPRMDGFQLLRAIKQDGTLKDIPFIFYSATYTGFKEVELAVSMGAEAFIVKPKDANEFWQELSGILKDLEMNKRKPRPLSLIDQDNEYLELYSHLVAAKLEEKVQELEKVELFSKSILESIDEGFIVVDREYRVLSANKAFLTKVGKRAEDVINRHCYEISHRINKPCFQAGEQCSVKGVFDTGEPHSYVHTHYDHDGNPIYIETKSYPMKDASGQIVSVIEICIDTTEKKKLEGQLRHAQKMEAVGQLAGGVAHDFNNILSAIIGYAHLLKMKLKDDDPLKHNVEQILASAERAANLTQSLLAFSRKQVINPRPVDVNDIIGKIQKLLQRIIGEDIELAGALFNGPLTVMADSGQLEQVLMNLCTNARDAMPNGGILTIATRQVKMTADYIAGHGYGKPGQYALITVTDTGAGMDKMTLARIFEPFFTTKEVGKGTGLGLSMAYGIIKSHEGFINAESEPGKGATFSIYLPLIKAMPEKMPPLSAAAETGPGGTETLLLAEDDAELRTLFSKVLREFGYTVFEAVDGEEAIAKFRENQDRIQFVLLDVMMPKKTGKEAYDEIRKMRPNIKALFMSGYASDLILKRGGIEEGVPIIMKPVSPTALLKKVRETLDAT